MDFEGICRRMLPPEKAEAMIAEHKLRIRQTQLQLRNGGVNRRLHQQRFTGVIPRPAYNAARAWVKRQVAELLKEDLERARSGVGFLAQIPTEYSGFGLEKWVDRELVGQFLCDMARQGLLEPHPMGGWMAARPRVKGVSGEVVEDLELPGGSNEGH